MTDEQLHTLLKEAVEESLQTIKSLGQRERRGVFRRVVEPDFQSDGSISKIREIRRPDVYTVQHILNSLPAVSKLCKFVASSNIAAQLIAERAADSPPEQVYHRLFLPFLDQYLSQLTTVDFVGDAFEATYSGVKEYFCADTIVMLFIAPLLGFNTETNLDSISLESSISIDKVPTQLKRQLWHDAPLRRSISITDIYDLTYQATIRVEVPKNNLFLYRENIDEDAEDLQALLRLMKREPISIMCIVIHSSPWFLGPTTGLVAPAYFPWPTADPIVGRYISLLSSSQGRVLAQPFSDDDIASLKALWNTLKNARHGPRLTLALRRLSSTYDRFLSTDKLVDCWIALEALFKKESETGGIGPLVAKRLSDLPGLCNSRSERKNAQKSIADSYECRKAIVHGQYKHDSGQVRLKDGREVKIADCCRTTRDYLERALTIILAGAVDLDAF